MAESDDEIWTTPIPGAGAVPAPIPGAGTAEIWTTTPSAGTAPDKYRAAAEADRAKLTGAGITPTGEGYARRIAQGASLGWADELLAGAETPIQMLRKGTLNPAEGYRYAKAGQDLALEKARAGTDPYYLGTAAEVAGGLVTGAGAIGPATRLAGSVRNYIKNIGVGGALGALGGAGEAPTVAEIPKDAALGSVLGMGISGAVSAVPHLARPLLGRMVAPDEHVARRLADVSRRADIPPERVVAELADAQAAGQPFNVADAFGKEGQRALAPIAKTPGARNLITETLTNRGEAFSNRLGEQLGEGLGVQGTAKAAGRDAMTEGRAAARPYYTSAMTQPTHSEHIDRLLADPLSTAGLKHGVERQRIRAAAENTHFDPLDHVLNAQGELVGVPNTRTLQTLKIGLDRMVKNETNAVTGELTPYGADINAYRKSLVREMGRLNPDYATANKIYGGAAQMRDAVQTGRDMATRGRYADTIPAFRDLAAPPGAPSSAQQQGVRIGVADKVLEQAESGNYPRYLKSGNAKGANELAELSLYQGPNRPGAPDQLRRRLNREQTMRETERAALGGSSTFENAADAGAGEGLKSAMGAVSSAAHGNAFGAVRNAYDMAAHLLKGETEAQRNAVARALLNTDPTVAQAMAARIAEAEARRRTGIRVFGQ